jgi:carboxyl-terminal processing protease
MKNNKSFLIVFFFFQVAIILGAYGLGYITSSNTNSMEENVLPILSEAYRILRENGLYEVTDEMNLEYGMIQGMVQAYGDPFTAHVEPVQNELQSDELTGSYGGIGSMIEFREDGQYYLLPYPNSPASNEGIQEHDRLIAVDDTPIENFADAGAIAAAVRGEVGTRVRITVLKRPDYQIEKIYTIKRQEVPLPSLLAYQYDKDPTVGVINIHIIADSTVDELENAILELQENGADKFIIDLRNNGGGLLDAGIELAELFLEEDQVIIHQKARGEEEKIVTTNRNGKFYDLQLVMIVNENTASAAEIFAGALQANSRAPLVGKQTYGKNTIQLVFNLQDESSFRVTNANWWFPAIDSFTGGYGLVPDVLISDVDSMEAAVLNTAIETLLNQ